MNAIIRPQSTAYTFRLGPFLDSTDAKTRKTALSITQATRLLSKAGAAYAQSAQSGTLSHDAVGYYTCTLASGDFDTLGELNLDVDIATALVVKKDFLVVTTDTYNALMGSGNGLLANINAINGVTSAAAKLALASGEFYTFTVSNTGFTPIATEFEAGDLSTAGTDHFKGRTIIFTSGALKGQATDITAYSVVGGRGHFTVTALNAAPSNGMTGLII